MLCCPNKSTFFFSDEMLDNDISHAVSIRIAILVEAVNCIEDKLVAGDGPILAAQHLEEITMKSYILLPPLRKECESGKVYLLLQHWQNRTERICYAPNCFWLQHFQLNMVKRKGAAVLQ